VKRRFDFLRAFLRDPGGDYNEYMLLLMLAVAITSAVIRAYRAEIRAALAWLVQWLLGAWR
jgi:hypothetical protein